MCSSDLDCLISKTYRGQPACFDDNQIQIIANKVANPIRDSLNFPSNDDQVRYIVDSMRSSPAHAGLVVHALRDRYEHAMSKDFVNYGNEFLRQVGLMATAVSNPGFGYPQQMPVQPQMQQNPSDALPSWPMNQQVQQYAQKFAQQSAPVQPVNVPPPQQSFAPIPQQVKSPDPLAGVNEAVQQQAAGEASKEELLAQLRELRSKAKG